MVGIVTFLEKKRGQYGTRYIKQRTEQYNFEDSMNCKITVESFRKETAKDGVSGDFGFEYSLTFHGYHCTLEILKADKSLTINEQVVSSKKKTLQLRDGDVVGVEEEYGFIVQIINSLQGENGSLKEEMVLLPYAITNLRTYPKFTSICGILEANTKDRTWFYNNYILFWAKKEIDNVYYWFDYKYGLEYLQEEFCPPIKFSEVNRKYIKGNEPCIFEFIKNCINHGYYLSLNINTKYIKDYWPEEKEPETMIHEILIYGYCEHSQHLYIADFFQFHYQCIPISYELFTTCYENCEYKDTDFSWDYETIRVVKYGEISYAVDLKRIKNLIGDFILSTDTAVQSYLSHREGTVEYGVRALYRVGEYLKGVLTEEAGVIDFRPFYTMCITLELMLERLQYLKEKGFIGSHDNYVEVIEEIKMLHTKHQKILRQILKYDLKREAAIIDNIVSNFYAVIEIWKRSFTAIYDWL